MERCGKCGGYLIQQRFYTHGEHFDGLRCVNCSQVTDATIEENHKFQPVDQKGSGRPGNVADHRGAR